MSDIERFVTIWGDDDWMMPASSGDWVRYDDHRAEVERVMADVVKLRIDLNSAQVAANQLRGEVERLKNAIDHLTSERNEAQAEVERLKEQVAALTVALEQADEMKAHAEAAAAAEEAETDRVMSERDAAQVEVERLRANGQAILDSSRPTDEDIWREGFMRCLNDVAAEDWRAQADLVLTTYRERWPR